ncbi:hypothetical protein A3D11_01155 [Candidatus Peribacteria bacterium RIFCSPHIGHO2_02_FULL_49_16]|nr:MAG: hypothetical protein A2880_02885 [Candidatus Peribacteria bacterium RIFCSPHIGHO2_01_FULL_49_38]OGJ58729.1 MAG: hypothetical protein A3D11_01155 [Candidatus Peribacteria bacterium RIFCSPHIGHO2_02_FULL_49_16]
MLRYLSQLVGKRKKRHVDGEPRRRLDTVEILAQVELEERTTSLFVLSGKPKADLVWEAVSWAKDLIQAKYFVQEAYHHLTGGVLFTVLCPLMLDTLQQSQDGSIHVRFEPYDPARGETPVKDFPKVINCRIAVPPYRNLCFKQEMYGNNSMLESQLDCLLRQPVY